MHPAVLDATGYILLFSSFITLAILLRKGCMRKRKSPFYILSTSDVLSTILTAIILLVNRIEAGIRLNYNTSGASNHTWTIEDESSYHLPFLQIYNLRTAADEADLNVNLTCDMKDVLMQYGMLLAALTNAFISLLTYTVQCNFNAACVKQRCADIINSSDTRSEWKSAEVAHREREMSKDEEQASQQEDDINVKKRSGIIQSIVKISKFRTLEDDTKSASFLIMSHWLVPLLVVAILYSAGYDDMNSSRTEDTVCVFESNFPMSNFHMSSDVEENLEIVNSIIHTTSLKNNYFLNEEYLNRSKPSSVEVDEIVSKVQDIVKSALNYTGNSTGNKNSPGSSETEKYILTNNITSYIKNNIDISSVIQKLIGTLTEHNVSVHNSSSDKNNDIYLSQDTEVLFHNPPKNTSEELDAPRYPSDISQVSIESNDSYQEDMQVHFAVTEENTTPRTTTSVPIVQNKTIISNPIYDDIIKRIQIAVKGHNRSINRHEERLERNNLNDRVARKPNSIRNLSSNKNDNLNHYINVKTRSDSLHVTNECLVSTEFLKLHLFVLFILIYFLPILFSCVLHMRGKHMCKNALAVLKAQADLVSPPPRNGIDSSEDNSTSIVHEFHSEFRRFPDDKRAGHQHSIEESNESQDLRNETDTQVIKKDNESCMETQNESILLEVDCMIRIFDTIKLSLILCVLLWTPAFLGTLLKVFSCIQVPQWLTDTTFLSAISFGVIRNILNMNIIKIQEVCCDASTKENRIHPIK